MNMEERMADEKEVVNNRRKKTAIVIFFSTIIILAIVGLLYIQYKKTHISTDDAFVEGSVYTIAPRIAGSVIRVHVKDNQAVEKGTLLVELDPEPYQKRLKEAEAGLEAERKRLSEIKAMIKAQESKVIALKRDVDRAISAGQGLEAMLGARKAELEAKVSILRQAEVDLKRAENLLRKGVIPQDRYDKAKISYETSLASVKAAEALKKQAEVSLKAQMDVIAQARAGIKAGEEMLNQLKATLEAQKEQVKRREASVELAGLNLSYTKIYSPEAGYVTKKSVQIGNQVQPGQPLMAVVSLEDVYVIANYKETKLRRIMPGQKVKIKVDAYPDRIFRGRVDSIMAGTGSAFSLFPPENATGNYVKVVQRIPVKIVLDDGEDTEHLLRVGMSMVPTVLVE
jgi:membrane fusion protein (multidrug efflux system)